MNRRQAIRARCLDCSAGSAGEVRNCPFTECSLYPFRMGSGEQDPKERNKAIRAYCRWCVNGQRQDVILCPSGACPLFRFRPYGRDTPESPKKHHIGPFSRKKTENEGQHTGAG